MTYDAQGRRKIAELEARVVRLEDCEAQSPSGDLPFARITWDQAGSRDNVFETNQACGEKIHCLTGASGQMVHVLIYRTRCGPVAKTTFVQVGQGPQRSPTRITNVRLTVRDGPSYETVEIDDPFPLPPGWPMVKSIYTQPGRAPLTVYDYWREAGEMRRHPTWAPDKLHAEPMPVSGCGPFHRWYHENGWLGGGQGIDGDFFFDWRHTPEGYSRAFEEMCAVAMRMPVGYLNSFGNPREWWSNPKMVLPGGYNTPEGYHWSPDDVKRWAGPMVYTLASWKKIDGQHLVRAWRCAWALRKCDPFARDFCDWLLLHAMLAWKGDPARDGMPSYYWTLGQLIGHLAEHPGPHQLVGREIAHVAGLAFRVAPGSVFAQELETMLHLACDTATGVPFLHSGSHYAPWARRSGGGPYGDDEPIAQTREWILLYHAMKRRPGLAAECERLLAFMGTNPPLVMNAQGRGFRDPNPFMHLMFGDLGGKTLEEWGVEAMIRKVDAHGSQPDNYLPEAFAEGYAKP